LLKTYLESSFPDGSCDPSALYAYPELRNRRLKWKKMIQVLSTGFWQQNAPSKSFLHIQMTIAQLRKGLED
jgi:hypothetical protein